MTRDELLREFPLVDYCRRQMGMTFPVKESANEIADKCPFHSDKRPSFVVNTTKEVWFCQPCNIGGSVIDLHMRVHNLGPKEAMRDLSEKATGQKPSAQAKPAPAANGARQLVKAYDYTNEKGDLIYQVVRYEPKDFRQRRPDGQGGWIGNMEGVMRVLYRLPAVLIASEVFIVEGEKDADTLTEAGFAATTNVGGAGKWLAAYSECLLNKDVVIFPDNDEPGRKHADAVATALADKANSIRVMKIPEPHKDVSDWLATCAEPAKAVRELIEKTPHLLKPLPIFTIEGDMARQYAEQMRGNGAKHFDLAKFVPSFRGKVRPLVPGDLVVVMADTGQGKTVILTNMAKAARPLPTLLFELELPSEPTFERLAAMETRLTAHEIEAAYKEYGGLPVGYSLEKLSHILVCPDSGLSTEQIERLIYRSELKGGERPAVVIVDYIGLVNPSVPTRSRYEAASVVAEQMKVIAKRTGTIVIVGTQIARPDARSKTAEVGLHAAKDSGSIENSCSLLIGAWRPEKDRDQIMLKILKNSRGRTGPVIACNFDGARNLITERVQNAGVD